MTHTITIKKINSRGEGIATNQHGETLVMPKTAIGDELRVIKSEKNNRNIYISNADLIKESPDRQPAPCAYFGDTNTSGCGGCQMQHLTQSAYRNWKRSLLKKVLEQHKIPTHINNEIWLPEQTRWRVRWHAHKNSDNTVNLGYFEPRSHKIISTSSCLLITDALQNCLKELPNLCGIILNKQEALDVSLTDIDGQIDAVIHRDRPITTKEIQLISNQWPAIFARISFKNKQNQTEPVYAPSTIYKNIGDQTKIALQPDTFLQASAQAEQSMQDFIITGLKNRRHKHIYDLFSGVGTLSLGLQNHLSSIKKITGFDSNPHSINSFKSTGTEGYVKDLHEQPLLATDFKKVDAVIIDPPRIGAQDQFKQLARSHVKTIVSISCHPETFARDAKLLLDAGYQLQNLTLLDQFIWSSHLEVMAIFHR